MNIQEAKQEVINTVRAYLKKDDTGAYVIPPVKQRPILLMGPPGIGKTAIMEQVAQECSINLVSYTITHHTRQSAIGLPFISQREYGGKTHAVTEYTMSEIIAAVYDQIERSGISEGILFLDEINCVSETLAPTMLQFLQYKMFGNHKVPEGFIVVTAGNPPQYNKSVRDFDIVTLDRVRRIDIEEDFDAFKEYAYRAGIHGAVMAYLEIRKQDFYKIQAQVEGKSFVTARAWEDLSSVLHVYEEMGIPVTEKLCAQYLQDPEVCANFAAYYELYNKYRNLYRIPDILEGTQSEGDEALRTAPFDEKWSLLGLLIDSLNQDCRGYAEHKQIQEIVLNELQGLRASLKEQEENAGAQAAQEGTQADALKILEARRAAMEEDLAFRKEAGLSSREEERIGRRAAQRLRDMERELKIRRPASAREAFGICKEDFDRQEQIRREEIERTDRHMTNSFRFLAATYGEGQEIVLFLSELSESYPTLQFVRECGNDAYYRYNKLLLLKDRRQQMREKALELLTL